jgi:hypothetical protein
MGVDGNIWIICNILVPFFSIDKSYAENIEENRLRSGFISSKCVLSNIALLQDILYDRSLI